jgi:hypothetical protein
VRLHPSFTYRAQIAGTGGCARWRASVDRTDSDPVDRLRGSFQALGDYEHLIEARHFEHASDHSSGSHEDQLAVE